MITPRELEWAAGFLEGEGSFTYYPCVSACQVQAYPLHRIARLFGGPVTYRAPGRYQPQQSGYYRWAISGSNARGAMMTLYVLMSPRRKAQIDFVLEQWRHAPGRPRDRAHCSRGHELTVDNVESYTPKDGITRRVCKECKARRYRSWRQTHSDYVAAKMAEWRATHRERVNELNRESYRRRKVRD